ncbi:hypothetical protein PO124_17085 [Bacillus licheniformis]|nr:hypothetical protein [Bacillus licheniformis]
MLQNIMFCFAGSVRAYRERQSVLSNLPQGSDMVISVPNYDSRAHVRHFKHIDEVIERYDGIWISGHRKVVIKHLNG